MRGVSIRSLLSHTPAGTPGNSLSVPEGVTVRDVWCDRRRGFRVLAIGTTTIAMCLVDLYLTILFVTSVGLHEGNPIARAVMLYNCTWVIVAFRLLTITLFALILVRARQHRIAEAAAFFCLAIMTWLMLRWMSYSEHSAELTSMMAVLAEHQMPEYVVFATDP